MEKINKDLLEKYLNEDMTMKEAKVFENQLYNRLYYIVKEIGVTTNRFKRTYEPHIDFYAGNENDDSNLMIAVTTKDSEQYIEYILLHSLNSRMLSEIKRKPADLPTYDESFPLRWLTEDFEEDLKHEAVIHESLFVKQVKEKKERKEQILSSFEQMQLNIKSKLTTEELEYITFLSKKDFLLKVETSNKKIESLNKKSKDTVNLIFSMANKVNVDLKTMFEKHKESNDYIQSDTIDSFIINNRGKIYKLISEKSAKYNIKLKV